MNKTQLITGETLKTIGQGALGAMTFGAYHQYTTNRIMDLNNEKMNIQHRYDMDRIESQHRLEMNEQKRLMDEQKRMMDEQKQLMIDQMAKLEKMIEAKRSWW
jgi:hypothetical protein